MILGTRYFPRDWQDDWPAASNLVEVFRHRATTEPDRPAYTFLGDEDQPAETITYGMLDRRARAIAAALERTAAPRSRALLMYGPGLDYIAALGGCLYAGMVAVPAYPPDPLRAARTLPRLEAIIRDAGASLVLGTRSDLAWTSGMLGQIPGVESLIATDQIVLQEAEHWVPPRLDHDTLALLQYTSGSTGAPKGVMVRHGNLLHNLAQIEQAIDVPDAVAVTWLPAYHDMGLIGGILQCWYSARHSVMLSPVAFFQRPLRWLQAIEQYQGTTTGAPDFAYELCVRKTTAEERSQLDLRCWKLALSGAEPVRPRTIERFVEAFAGCGVRREIFRPCFGLAEATLMVSCSNQPEPPMIRAFDAEQLALDRAVEVDPRRDNSRLLAGCGPSVWEQRIAIVNPQSLVELPAGEVGEIWVSGKNVAAGYWNRPEDSAATFGAHTAAGAGPFLRTGDAGFLHHGQLFISGRLKDMIIVHGRNHYPQDLEYSVETCHEAFKSCRGAAFSVESRGQEQVVVVHEVSRPKKFDLDEVSRVARWAVLDAHDVLIDSLVLIRQGTLPKTTSGKVQRSACREQYLRDELQALHRWRAPQSDTGSALPEAHVAPRTPTERLLADAWAEVLGVPRVGVHDNFIELGGHSLMAAQLVNRLGQRLGVDIPLAELFARPTVAALAELVDCRRAEQLEAERQWLDTLEAMTEDEVRTLLSTVKNATLTPSPDIFAT